MARQLKYNGTALDTFNVFWDGSKRFTTPRKNAKFYSVPARNGDIVSWDGSFSNVELQVDCFIRENFEQNFSALVKYLYTQEGYNELIFDTDDGYYRMAQFVNAIVPNTGAYNDYAHFTLVFNCVPQKFSTSQNEVTVTSDVKGSLRVLDRNDPRITAVFNLLDPSQIPTDTLFFLKQIAIMYDEYTGFDLSWTEGNIFSCIYQETSYGTNEIERIINVSQTSVVDLSFTATLYHSVNVIVAYRDSGAIPIYFMHGTTGDWTRTIGNVGTNKVTIESQESTGVDFGDITANMLSTASESVTNSWIVIRKYLNNNLVAEGNIKITVDGSIDLADHKTGYAYDLVLNTDAMTCYCVKNGLPDINCNKYINMIGDFDGICDKATIDVLVDGSYGRGYIGTVKVTPTWWKL